jgi:hypothetical protein
MRQLALIATLDGRGMALGAGGFACGKGLSRKSVVGQPLASMDVMQGYVGNRDLFRDYPGAGIV